MADKEPLTTDQEMGRAGNYRVVLSNRNFLVIAAAIALARLPRQAKASEGGLNLKSLLLDIREGFSFIKSKTVLLSVILMAVVANMAFAPLVVIAPLFVENVLQAGPQGFGYLLSCLSLGTLAGMLLLGAWGGRVPKGKIIIGGFVLTGLAVGMTGATFRLYQTLLSFFFIGGGLALINVPFLTVEQQLSPDSLRGKVLSTDRTLAMAATPLAQAGAGFIAESVGARLFFGLVSGVLLLCALFGGSIRGLRETR